MKKWPDVNVRFSRGKGYYYDDNRQIVDAVQYFADVSSSAFHIQLSILQDKATKQVVSGPDAWMASPEHKRLVGSPRGTAKLQDTGQVLKVIEQAVEGPRTEKQIAEIKAVAQTLANQFDHHGVAQVHGKNGILEVSFWGEFGDDPPGWRSGRQWDEEYARDMRARKSIHDRFLRSLQEELSAAKLMPAIAKIESVYGVPDDAEHYTFNIVLK